MRKNFKIDQKCARGSFERKSGRGKKFFRKSIETYKTNTNMKKYQNILHKCGRGNMNQQTCAVSLSLDSVC